MSKDNAYTRPKIYQELHGFIIQILDIMMPH